MELNKFGNQLEPSLFAFCLLFGSIFMIFAFNITESESGWITLAIMGTSIYFLVNIIPVLFTIKKQINSKDEKNKEFNNIKKSKKI